MKIRIAIITALETHKVRHPVLRKGRPLASCAMDGDNKKSTVHWGAYLEHTLVGVVSLLSTPEHLDTQPNCKQIRGMAVLKNYRNKGIGKALILCLENHAQKTTTAYLWMNARKKAFAFYQDLGFSIKGNLFEIEPIGTHGYLYKFLT